MAEWGYKALGRLDFRQTFLLAPSALRGLRLPSSRSLRSRDSRDSLRASPRSLRSLGSGACFVRVRRGDLAL